MNETTTAAIAFALVWEKAKRPREVAKHYGITEQSAVTRAHEYRKKGIELKFMRPEFTPNKIDVEEVNRAIAALDEEGDR
jgi:transposase